MNEDWLKKVHDRMSDYEIDEPDNLWEAIESGLPDISPGPLQAKKHAKKPLIMPWVKRSLAAAALIGAIVSLGVYLTDNEPEIPDIRLITAVSDKTVTPSDNTPKAAAVSTISKLPAENLIAQNDIAPGTGNAVHTPATNSAESPADIDMRSSDQQPVPPGEPENKPEPTDRTPDRIEHPGKELTTPRADYSYNCSSPGKDFGRHNLSVSIYSTEGTGSALNFNSKGNSIAGVIGPDESDWEDNPKLGILLFNQGKDIETEIKHRLPIKAGVSFAYSLNQRVSIETGVSYSILISDIKEGSKSHYYIGKQKLHYIGIPLNLKYRVLSWKRFDLYASSGVLAEKCISAKIDKDFILDHRKKDSESEKLSDKPMQWSVNASAGVQYNLLNSMSIFVEPGISYYFDDGTDIPTIYKDKPLNFNLNMGLRFTFGTGL